MSRRRNMTRNCGWLIIVMILMTMFPGVTEGKATKIKLDNGMEVIFKENHSSPMITSMVFVRAGAKYENEFNNGVTHLLEHLLFDGTKSRTSLELTDGIEKHGGYINAYTRPYLTGYLVLMPKENIQYGLDIQADQLFNSIFPEDQLAKERKVVIEEIRKDNDDESSLAEYYFSAKSMAGTPYERPVLGYRNTIASIPRDKIIEYWKRFYAPNNMIGLVIGDFKTEEMIDLFRSVYEVIPAVNLPSPPVVNYFPPVEQKIYRKAGNTKMTHVTIGIDAPHFTDPDYYAFDLLAAYLNSEENSPFSTTLVDAKGRPLYQSLSVSLETAEEFSRLIIDVTTDDETKASGIIAGVAKVLKEFDQYRPSAEVLDGIKVSKKVEDIYMSEKLHYYGFIAGPLLVTAGWDFMESYRDAVDLVNPTMMVRAADRWLDTLKYIATVFYPKKEAAGEAAEKVFTVYKKEVLPNGLTVVVKSNPDSRVFALNVIGKNRSASEPPGKDGITDFVNRLVKKGTTSLNAQELSNALAAIGANVTVCDNPWIPYDDRYTTRQFAFMKFETIDDYTEKGLQLFADMIRHPAFDSASIEEVRGVLMGVVGRESGSTLNACRDLYYATLFEGQPYAKAIDGSPRTIGAITRADLVEHHKKFYSAENMIITIGTNYGADSMMTLVKAAFGAMPKVTLPPSEPILPVKPVGIKPAHKQLEKEQIYIFLGTLIPGALDSGAVAIEVAAEVLSRRLGKTLREEQGLAYSVGAGVALDRDFGWLICSMGTGAGNFEVARDGIVAQIKKLKEEGPTAEELDIAKNSMWGSLLTARLSRINQAYYMGVDEYLGLGYDHETGYVEKLRAVTAAQVKAAAAAYFDTDNYVLATAGKM
jgi:zinc protease